MIGCNDVSAVRYHDMERQTIENLRSCDFQGKTILTIQKVDEAVFSPDGQLLATAGEEPGCIMLWETHKDHCISLLKDGQCASPEKFREIVFSPDGQFIAAISSDSDYNDRAICIWKCQNGKWQAKEKKVWASISIQSYSNSEMFKACNRLDFSMMLLKMEMERINCMSLGFSGDSKYIYATQSDRGVPVWDTSGKSISAKEYPKCLSISSRWMPETEATMLVVRKTDGKGVVEKLKATNGETLTSAPIKYQANPHFSPDGKYIMAWLEDEEKGHYIELYANNGELLETLPSTGLKYIDELSFSSDSKYIVVNGLEDDKFFSYVWSIENKKLYPLEDSSHRFLSTTFSSCGKLVASTNHIEIGVWDIEQGDMLYKIHKTNEDETINNLSFSPDGKSLMINEKYVSIYHFSASES